MMHQKQKESSIDEYHTINDREIFFQSFEKPTQIYRYLSIRQQVHPIFLSRNLSYLKRCLRKANTRNGFRVDDILKNVGGKQKSKKTRSYKPEFLNLTFLGFVDKTLDASTSSIEVEVTLSKLSHNKRKETLSADSEYPLGRLTVPCNPHELTPSKTRALSLASELFVPPNGQACKSYVVNIRAWHMRKVTTNGWSEGDDGNEMAKKRRKLSDSSTPVTGGGSEDRLVKYRSSLTIYDQSCRCLLVDGDYEVALVEQSLSDGSLHGHHTRQRKSTWESISDSKVVENSKLMPQQPIIKFRVSWNKQSITEDDAPDSLPASSPAKMRSNGTEGRPGVSKTGSGTHRVIYRFVYGGFCHMETEMEQCLCPWCALHCDQPYSLLKHLRLCHARLCFICNHSTDSVTRIDVTVNEDFNGSYVGHPEDQCNLGLARCRLGPTKRTSVTQIIVSRSKKPSFDMAEFQEHEGKVPKGHLIHGHNRLYYHSTTCAAKRAVEFSVDSEDENDPEWLRQKTVNLIDEFTDVNDAEMRLMKLWNLHIIHYNFIGDCHVVRACETFLADNGKKLVDDHLVHNFLLHLCNLSDYGLLQSDALHSLMMKLYSLEDELRPQSAAIQSHDSQCC